MLLVACSGAPAEDGSLQKVRVHRLGGRGVLPSQWSHVSRCRQGMVGPKRCGSRARGTQRHVQPVVARFGARRRILQKARGHGLERWGHLPSWWLHVSQRQQGMVAPKRHGVMGWRDGMPYPTGGYKFQGAGGGWWPAKAWVHRLGGRGVPPNWWAHISKRLCGMVAPKRRGVTGLRDGIPCPAGGCTFQVPAGVPPKGAGSRGGGTGVLTSQWSHVLDRRRG